MSAPGQLDMDGGEVEDPRIENAAKSLYLKDVKRRHQCDDELAKSIAKVTWPRVEGYYKSTVRQVLGDGGFQ